MVVIVHPGIDLLRGLLGKDRCFGSEALNGCSTWGNGTLLCGGVAFLAWPRFGFVSLIFVPLVPIAATFIWTTCFYRAASRVRKREFTVQDGFILRCGDRTRIEPIFVIDSGWYSQTGPATGYGASVLQLGDENGVTAENVYVDTKLAENELDTVMATAGPRGCRLLDVSFVAQVEPGQWHVVRLKPVWTPLLCGSLEQLTASDRSWWRRWCQPDFGNMGRTTVESQSVSEHLDRLVAAYPRVDEKHPDDAPGHDGTPTLNLIMGTVRPHDDVRALRSLLARHATIDIVTSRAHDDEIQRARRERGITEHSFDDSGVDIQTLRIFG